MLSKSSTPSETFFNVRSISAVGHHRRNCQAIISQKIRGKNEGCGTYFVAFVQPWVVQREGDGVEMRGVGELQRLRTSFVPKIPWLLMSALPSLGSSRKRFLSPPARHSSLRPNSPYQRPAALMTFCEVQKAVFQTHRTAL